MSGSKISNVSENDSFAVSFVQVEIRKKGKKDYTKVGENKVGLDYRIVNTIIGSLESGLPLKALRWDNLEAQKQWAGLA